MRIAILTHPLGKNYGGILQAFALSTYLKKKGFDVYVLNRQANMSVLKRVIKQILIFIHHPRYNNTRYKNMLDFVKKYIDYSMPIYTSNEMSKFISRNEIKAVIVGSDQVWRSDFAMHYGYDYFLSFVPNDVFRIAYAASFGLSEWMYSKDQTEKIKNLINTFRAVSVREENAVYLCKDNLCIDVEHVLDPTMLLDAEDYEAVTSSRLVSENYIFVYWLGSEDKKMKAILSANLDKKKIIDISLKGNDLLSSIENWLSYIKYADHVITDSFHGLVFSILFKKQFTVYENRSGGNDRISSLLRMLDISLPSEYIDYETIDQKLNFYRKKSCRFIENVLLGR